MRLRYKGYNSAFLSTFQRKKRRSSERRNSILMPWFRTLKTIGNNYRMKIVEESSLQRRNRLTCGQRQMPLPTRYSPIASWKESALKYGENYGRPPGNTLNQSPIKKSNTRMFLRIPAVFFVSRFLPQNPRTC